VTVREALDRDGFAVVRGLLRAAEVADLAVAFDALVATARTLPGPTDVGEARFVVDAAPFRLHRVTWCGGASDAIARYGPDPRFVHLAAEVLGSDDLVQLIQQAHFKLPGDGVDFGWHQDASNRRYGSPEWNDVDGRGSFAQIALAIDPMSPDNGGLRFLPGTQRLGFVADPRTGALPPSALEGTDVVSPVLAPGDAVVFGPFVIHGSGPNTGTIPRRLFLQGYALPGANGRVYPGCGLGVARRR
jgi:ectoine hydroxylase-related dioxygenase (phytanoyl-CoA dioxygenase family)